MEVLLVLAILTILATLAVSGITDVLDRARAARTFSDMLVVSKAVDMFVLDHGEIPNSDGMGNVDELAGILVPQYVNHLPVTDGWGNEIYYEQIITNAKNDANNGNGGNPNSDTSQIPDNSDGSTPIDQSNNQGNGQSTWIVCHAPGTEAEGSITVATPAVLNAHLAHGDYMGECTPQEGDDGSSGTKEMIAYRVYSFGKDGLPDSDVVTGLYFDTTSDIVVENGVFIQWKY